MNNNFLKFNETPNRYGLPEHMLWYHSHNENHHQEPASGNLDQENKS